MVKEIVAALRRFWRLQGLCRIGPVSWPSPGLRYENPERGQVEKIQVAEADGAGFGAALRSDADHSLKGPGRARPAVLAVDHPAPVMNAERPGFRAIGEDVPAKLRQFPNPPYFSIRRPTIVSAVAATHWLALD